MNVELSLLELLCLALALASATTFVFVMITQPLLEPPQHGLRALKRARARASVEGFASFEWLLRWIGARVAPLMSAQQHAALAQRIMIAGELWGLWPAEMQALSVLAGLAGLACGALMVALGETALYLPILGALGLMVPNLQLASLGSARVRSVQRRIPHVVDLLVLALGAGLDFPAALRQVVERAPDPESPVSEELGLVLEELKLGRTRRQALERFAQRAPSDEVRDLVSATIQAEEQGTPLGIVLESQASTSRQRRSTRAEELASKASNAMVLPTLLLFAALMLLILGPMLLTAMHTGTQLSG
jgi:tight adherence protein C